MSCSEGEACCYRPGLGETSTGEWWSRFCLDHMEAYVVSNKPPDWLKAKLIEDLLQKLPVAEIFEPMAAATAIGSSINAEPEAVKEAVQIALAVSKGLVLYEPSLYQRFPFEGLLRAAASWIRNHIQSPSLRHYNPAVEQYLARQIIAA